VDLCALGMMSGTSLDGIDAAILRTDGHRAGAFGPWRSAPYGADMHAALRASLGGASDLDRVARDITQAHVDIVHSILEDEGLTSSNIDVIGFHGQTILHRPAERLTVQIGDGADLAARTGIDVVCDFRSADVAAGGQGAPLAPLYHAALAADLPRPLAVLNIGGIANVTYLGADGPPSAFDTGPGNCLLDDWVAARSGLLMDRDGALALTGQIAEGVLAALMTHPYFDIPPPKSLDRGDFSLAPLAGLSAADGAATLAAFTARAVARAAATFPRPPGRWLVGGGGRRNPALMAALHTALAVPVDAVEAVGWRGDALEAEAFAFLAVRALKRLPLSLPSTTGVARPTTGGVLHSATRRPRPHGT
jgi:anhydro-N-acetylmuramic acid kinase